MPSKRKGPVGATVATDLTTMLLGLHPSSSLRVLRMRKGPFCLIVVAVIYFVLLFQSPNSDSASGSFYLFCLLCRLCGSRWKVLEYHKRAGMVFICVSTRFKCPLVLALFCFLYLLLHLPLPPCFLVSTLLPSHWACWVGCTTARGLSASLPAIVLVLVVQTASLRTHTSRLRRLCPLSVRSLPAVSPHAPPLSPHFPCTKVVLSIANS